MKLRPTIIATCAVSLVLGIGGVIQWQSWNQAARRPTHLPALTRDQLWSMPTFQRGCSRQDECEPPLSCVLDRRVRGHRCLGNECNSDADCETNSVCRAMASEGHPVRLCVVQGVKEEGERCAQFPLDKQEACGGNLLCNRTFCGRRCRLDNAASCAEGFTCLKNGELEPSCAPECLRHGCPDGKRCFQLEEGLSVCGVLGSETDCEAQPCPPGEKCRKTLDASSDSVYLRCYRPCDATTPCPAGHFCAFGTCVEECDPSVHRSCGPDRKCAYHKRLRKGLCL